MQVRLRWSAFAFLAWLVPALAAAQTTVAVTPPGCGVQAAIDAAHRGDTITIAPECSFVSIVLRNKGAGGTNTDADFITIRTANLAGISADGVRINPAQHYAAMPKLNTNWGAGLPNITNEPGASYYRVIGLDVSTVGATGGQFMPVLIQIDRASHIYIDRCFIHPGEISATNLDPLTPLYRSASQGIQFEGSYLWAKHNWIDGFAGYQAAGPGESTTTPLQSMGVYTVGGPGPDIEIDDNYIAVMFNNVMTGGGGAPGSVSATVNASTATTATLSNVANLTVGKPIAFSYSQPLQVPGMGVVNWGTATVTGIAGTVVTFVPVGSNAAPRAPDVGGTAVWQGPGLGNVTDIRITRNTMEKRASWKALGFCSDTSVGQWKGYGEFKDADGLQLIGNTLIGNGCAGAGFAFYPQNQYGNFPWVKMRHVVAAHNRFVNAIGVAFMFSLNSSYLYQAEQGSDIDAYNNLVESLAPSGYNSAFVCTGGDNVRIRHNTVMGATVGMLCNGYGTPMTRLTFSDNIATGGSYWMNCQIAGADCWPNKVEAKNALMDPLGNYVYYRQFPNSTVVPNAASIGFVDAANKNFRLASTSPFHNAASDGKDVGVDMDALMAAQSATPLPPTPPPPPPLPPPAPACGDGLDNDGDGLIDLGDPGCANNADTDETNLVIPPPSTPDTVAPDVTLRVTRSGNSNNYTLTATTTAGDAVRADFYVDGKQQGMSTVAPFSVKVIISVPGNHAVKAELRDAAGNVGQASRTVTR